jgi:hypothetical protein
MGTPAAWAVGKALRMRGVGRGEHGRSLPRPLLGHTVMFVAGVSRPMPG